MSLKKFLKKAVGVALVVGAAIVTGGGSLLVAAAVGAVVGTIAAVKTLVPKMPTIPTFSPTDQSGGMISGISGATGAGVGAGLKGQTVSSRNPIASHKIIYGRTRTGGTIVHMEATGSNKYIHIVIAITGHEIDAFEKVFFDDAEVTLDGGIGFDGKARVQYKLGTDDQTAFSSLVSESEAGWTNNHRLRGRSAAYIRLEYDQDKFPSGIPNISFQVRGKKVYDPRTATTVWSANPALITADYLSNTRYGLGASFFNEIDQTALTDAANVCDQDIDLAAGGTEKRYEAHGVIDTGNTPEQVMNRILSAMNGTVVYINGKWKILPGIYRTPTLTFDENDLVGGIRVQSLLSRRETFNCIKGIFSSKLDNYVATDFPPIVSNTFISQDSGEKVFKSIELTMTTSATMAQRLAKIELLRSRQQISVSMPMKLTALQMTVGDVVYINNTRMGWSNKPFEVISLDINADETIVINADLREISTDVFDWSTSEEQAFDPAPNTNLPDVFSVRSPGLALSDRLEIVNQQVASILVAEVTGGDLLARNYEVEVKKQTDTIWTSLGQSTGTIFEFPFVEDSIVYDVRARVINALGVRSPFTTASRQIVGQTAPPQNVTGFSLNIVGNTAHFSWDAVPDLDLSHYKIRYSSQTSGATYSNAIDLIPKISRPATFATAAAMTGTYFIKAYDKSGIASSAAAEIVAQIDSIEGLNVIEVINEHPLFNGQKTNVVALDNFLLLDTTILFDSTTGDFDDGVGLFDGGGGDVASSGEYEFDDYVDLSAIYTSRVTASIESTRLDYVNTFDSPSGNFDDRQGLFDGDESTYDDVSVGFFVATTNDDPAGTPTWSDWRPFFVGDYTARAFKFKVILTTEDPQATPAVSLLSVSIDMPDRVTSAEDIVSGTDAGGKVVTFVKAFKVAPALGIAAQNLQQGDFYEITTKSASGFTIRFKDSGGTVVNRTFDYVAKGYGALTV
jgi:hypothetical protein